MSTAANALIALLLASVVASCGTTMTGPNGAKFTTYSNGKSLKMELPGGGSLQMEDYDHASSILATGQAIKTGTESIVGLGRTALWTRLWSIVSGHTADTATHLDDNKTGLTKHLDDNKTGLDTLKASNDAGLAAQGAGAEVTPVTIK